MSDLRMVLQVENVPVVLLARALATQGLTIHTDLNGDLHVVLALQPEPVSRGRKCTVIADDPHAPRRDKTRCTQCGGAKFPVSLPPTHHEGDGTVMLVPGYKCINCGDVTTDVGRFEARTNGNTDELSFGTAGVTSER